MRQHRLLGMPPYTPHHKPATVNCPDGRGRVEFQILQEYTQNYFDPQVLGFQPAEGCTTLRSFGNGVRELQQARSIEVSLSQWSG
eukprot:1786072-Amphidinium_carterae.1